VPKGNILEASKLAGIMGAKKTSELLPFCHPISFQHAEVEVKLRDSFIEVFAFVKGIERTGYEMEALTAVSVALLTIYDMCKGMDESMVIEEIKLLEKQGGKSQWGANLRGIKVSLDVEEEIKSIVVEYLTNQGAILTDNDYKVLITTKDYSIKEELYPLNTVINYHLFSVFPNKLRRGVCIGRDEKGRLIISIEKDKDLISAFFENFSDLLGNYADGEAT